MGVLASSYKGSAQATAFSRGMSPERFAQRSEAYTNKEKSDQELETLRATKLTDKDHETIAETQSLQLQSMLQQQTQMVRDGNRLTSHQAFERYDTNGYDVKPINQMLADLRKRGSKLYPDIARVDNLNITDMELMKQAGLSNADISSILDDPEVNGSYVKVTDNEGNLTVRDLDYLKGMTQYNDYANPKELTRQKDVQDIKRINALGYETGVNTPEAMRRTIAELGENVNPEEDIWQETYTKHFNALRDSLRNIRGSGFLSNEKDYAARKMRDLGIDESDPRYNGMHSEFIEEYKNLADPAKQKLHDAGKVYQKELQEMKFMDMDTSNIKQGSDQWYSIEEKVQGVEKLLGYELDAKTKTDLKRIQGVAHLGDKASELTEKETGLLDNLWFGIHKYIFDEAPSGTDAAAAYALFRNTARHAQFGSVLPAGEIKSFAEAFGSMGMQIGPVLTMLRESLMQQMHQYKAIAQMENPYVMKWRTGMGAIELQDTINKLDERISMIDAVANDTPISVSTTPPASVGATMTEERKAAGRRLIEQRKQPIGDGQ